MAANRVGPAPSPWRNRTRIIDKDGDYLDYHIDGVFYIAVNVDEWVARGDDAMPHVSLDKTGARALRDGINKFLGETA